MRSSACTAAVAGESGFPMVSSVQLGFADGRLFVLRWEWRRIKEHFMSKVSQWSSPLHGTRPT